MLPLMRRLGLVGVVLFGTLAAPTAHAGLSCGEILNMVSVNVPTDIVVQTMKGSGTQFTADDIRCLAEGGAAPEIVDTARSMSVSDAPAPVTRPTEPEATPATTKFDEAESLGSDMPTSEDFEEGASSCGDLEELVKAYQAKKVLTSSYGLYDLLQKGSCPDEESRIHYYLAKSLYDLEMYHGAQHYFLEVVRKGPSNPYFKYALPKMVAIADLTGNDAELFRIVHKIPPEAFPAQAKNHLYYLMGRKLYEDENLTDAATYFAEISTKSDLFLRSKYYEGVIANEKSRVRSAVKAFSEVYDAELDPRDAREAQEVNDLKDLALMNIARIYFQLDKFPEADDFYRRVDRESGYWPDSLFERAYANFWRNDLNLTLGLLLTLRSPYYDEERYLPEAEVLRALAFFQLCDFPEVERILLNFEREYGAMHQELKGFLSQYSTPEAKKLTDQAFDAYFTDSKETVLSKAMFVKILRNREMAGLVRHMDMMDDELVLIDAQKSQWKDLLGANLKQVIAEDRARYKQYAGRVMLQQMANEYQELSDLMTQSEVIRFEVVDAQRADYEFRMQNPDVESEEDKKVDFAVSKTIIYWPFNGEFWKDELGYYRYSEQSSCN